MPLQLTDVPSMEGIQATINEARDAAFVYTDERTTEKPYASLVQTATQNCVNGVTTAITWDDIDTVRGGLTASSTGVTIAESGEYRITAQAALNDGNSTTGIMSLAVLVNGASTRVVSRTNNVANSPTVENGSCDLTLSAGNEITIGVFHNNGVDRPLWGGTLYATTLVIEKIN